MAGQGNMNQATPSSFGVEMEGYIAYIIQTKEDEDRGVIPVPKMSYIRPQPYNWSVNAAPLVVPQSLRDAHGLQEAVNICLLNLLTTSLQLGGAAVVPLDTTQDQLNTEALSHLQNYRQWTVKEDGSLDPIPRELRDIWDGPDRGFCGIELCSPAMWATDQGMEELRRVCQFLTNRLWVSTTDACGLHVHWGIGTDWIPLERLRQIAALIYAADGLIVQLHPDSRRDNDFCRAPSMFSRLATGSTAATVEAELAFPPEDEPAPLPQPRRGRLDGWCGCCPPVGGMFRCLNRAANNNPDNMPATNPPNDAEADGLGPRNSLGGYTRNDQFWQDLIDIEVREGRLPAIGAGQPYPQPTALNDGVRELLRANDVETVAELLSSYRGPRLAYNFNAYIDGLYDVEGNKRTIEFRQAAGSFDPDEVCAWAKVVVGLCEFASGTPEDVLPVVYACAAPIDPTIGWYDVFDLLERAGLMTEARVLNRFARRRRGLPITPTGRRR